MAVIRDEQQLTDAVLAEVARTPDPRTRELLGALVRHLHAFVRETRLTEAEFQQACGWIAALGQRTTASHNEVVLMAGSLGVSSLVCLVNHAQQGPTTANLLGPFWRPGAPRMCDGDSIVRSPTPGEPVSVELSVVDREGRPVDGADVEVWHASPEGFYENQDPSQADMNLRGIFTTDARGRVRFRTVKPAGYPIPVDGPVGALLRAQGRHNLRPAHLHVLIHKEGFRTHVSQLYSDDDPHLSSDVQFAVTEAVVARYERQAGEGHGCRLAHTFVLERGVAARPRPPIAGRASERPVLAVLERRPSPPGDRD